MLLAIKRTKSRQRFYDYIPGKKQPKENEETEEISEMEKIELNKFKESMWDIYLKLISLLKDQGNDKACF